MAATASSDSTQNKSKLFYGWIIVIAVTLIYSIAEIPVFAFGIFVKPIAGEMECSREVIIRAFGLYMVLLGIFSLINFPRGLDITLKMSIR